MWSNAQRSGELGGRGRAFPQRGLLLLAALDRTAIETVDLRSVQSKAPQTPVAAREARRAPARVNLRERFTMRLVFLGSGAYSSTIGI
jgi:hypothetical protein